MADTKFTRESLVAKIDDAGALADFLLYSYDPDDFEGTEIEYLIDIFAEAKESLEEAVQAYEKLEEAVGDEEQYEDDDLEDIFGQGEDD